MSSDFQPIKLFGKGGPNPPKVAFILEELHLSYEVVAIPIADVKEPFYTDINPNGRLPSLKDPNTGVTVWESGAIIEYLIETYDKEHILSFPTGTPEHFHAKQWLYFQVSGQGPYFGQLAWFLKFHHEQVPSAIQRYADEVDRVSKVLDKWLAKQKKDFGDRNNGPWLVGGKISYADIAFLHWYNVIAVVTTKEQYDAVKYPELKAWLEKIQERPAIAKVIKDQGGKAA